MNNYFSKDVNLYDIILLSNRLIKNKDDKMIFIFTRLLTNDNFGVRTLAAKSLISYQKINKQALNSLILMKPQAEILAELDLMMFGEHELITVGVILYIIKCSLSSSSSCVSYANILLNNICKLILENKIKLSVVSREEVFIYLNRCPSNIIRKNCIRKLKYQ